MPLLAPTLGLLGSVTCGCFVVVALPVDVRRPDSVVVMLGLNVVAGGPSGVGVTGADVVGLVRDLVGSLVGLNLPRLSALVVVTTLGPSVVTATLGR